jgi:hypothetical protein
MADNDSGEIKPIQLFFIITLAAPAIYSILTEQNIVVANIRINLFWSGIYVSIGEILLILLCLLVSVVFYLIVYRGFQLDHLRFRCEHPLTSKTGIVKIVYDKKVKELKQENEL